MKTKSWLHGLVIICCLMQGTVFAAPAERQLMHKEEPFYPVLLKKLNITGTVKLQVVVASTGAVSKVTTLGGNPMLAQQAMDAVRQWKYVPADSESVLTVEVRFTQ